MTPRTGLVLPLAAALLACLHGTAPAPACCPVFLPGKPVVNADQTVIILWDAATQTEHFIRQASFKSDADDFGFLVPTPSQPELSESGNGAFPFLQKLTEPEVQKRHAPINIGCTCSSNLPISAPPAAAVKVLDEKMVAGFHAVVLEASSATDLVGWLKDNGYAFSPEVAAWAKPYVDAGWKITALKVAKARDEKQKTSVAAAALRISFKTDRPLFPYREPDSASSARALGAKDRLLRIYFIADARYQGDLTREVPWKGRVAWSNKISAGDRQKVLELLRLPETTGPATWWLTEFEDDWPYQVAPADVTFTRGADQNTVKRPPTIQYVSSGWPTDVMGYALAAALIVPPLLRRIRCKTSQR